MNMRFLLDEHMAPRIKTAILHRNPLIDVLRVGEAEAPPLATPDPDILAYLEQSQRAFITRNRRSMLEHYRDHMLAGRTHWGIFIVSSRLSMSSIAEEIEMLWQASEAEEWIDCLQSLPL
jgi:hypothetical protein